MKKIDEKTTRVKKTDGRKNNGGSRTNTGGKREGCGRKKFKATKEEKKQVESLSGYGVRFEHIASIIRDGICIDTLRKYFAKELIAGKAKANGQIGKRMFENAINGDTKALIWWSKSQMGWSEVQKLEHSSPDGTMSNNNFTRQEIEEELKNRGLPTKIFDE